MFIMEIKVILIRPLIKKVSKLHVCINMLMPDKTPIHTTLEIYIYIYICMLISFINMNTITYPPIYLSNCV